MITNIMKTTKQKMREAGNRKPAFGQPRSNGAKIKNSNLRLKSAGEPSQRASQQRHFLIGGQCRIRLQINFLTEIFRRPPLAALAFASQNSRNAAVFES